MRFYDVNAGGLRLTAWISVKCRRKTSPDIRHGFAGHLCLGAPSKYAYFTAAAVGDDIETMLRARVSHFIHTLPEDDTVLEKDGVNISQDSGN